MNLNDGKEHIVKFSKGNLYIDDKQVAGDGIVPAKDVVFKFRTNAVISAEPVVGDAEFTEENPPDLSVNVNDTVAGADIGPGQK